MSYEEARMTYFKKQLKKEEQVLNFWDDPCVVEAVGSPKAREIVAEAKLRVSFYRDVIELLGGDSNGRISAAESL